MRKFISPAFWDYALERALKTLIQTLFAGGAIGGALFGLDWAEIASIGGGAALASIATSILVYRGDGSDDPNDVSTGGKYGA